jgi:hypothetical protein
MLAKRAQWLGRVPHRIFYEPTAPIRKQGGQCAKSAGSPQLDQAQYSDND